MAILCKGDSIVQRIDRTECIGNSLTKINSNFKGLDIGVCELQVFNLELLQNEGMLKCETQQIKSAVPGIDYTRGTAGIVGILKSNAEGTIFKAVSSVDYWVPRTELNAFNTTITGTLSTSGNCWFNNVYAKGDVIAFTTSDERLKNDIVAIPNALQKLETLQGVEYNWNTELQNVYSGHDVGVLAQEVEQVLPEAVTQKDNGYKAVNYEKIIPLLIEAIKELKAEVETLKSKVQ